MIALSGCLSGRVCKALEESRAADAAGRARPARAGLRPRQRLRRAAERAPRGAGSGSSRSSSSSPPRRGLPTVATGDVHYLRARGRARPRGAALHPVGRLAQEPEPLEVRDRPLLLQDAGGDGRATSPATTTRCAARSRSPSAATSRSSSAGSCCRSSRSPTAATRSTTSSSSARKACKSATAPSTPELQRAAPLRAEDDQGDGLHRLLPDRLGLHPLRRSRTAISVGPGRGSAAGCLVAYCLEITDLDPIRYDLLFERFLNPGRKSMPDMDIDFAVAGRERVINYVTEKYGRDRVAQIITFSTMAARAAVRDAGRVLEVPYGVVDKIAKLIPEGPGQTLDECLKPGAELRKASRRRPGREGDRRPRAAARRPDARRLDPRRRRRDRRRAADERRAAAAEGRRPGGRHAVPDGRRRGARPAEDGLPRPAQPRRDRQGRRADRRTSTSTTIPLDDKKTYEMLARGEATGVFQFESSGMREALRQVQADRVRGPDRARRALPAGPDAVHPDLREPQARQGAGHATSTRA